MALAVKLDKPHRFTVNTNFVRLAIAGLLLLTIGAAITHPSQSYFPVLEVEASDRSNTLTLSFLFDSRPNLHDCEALTGNVARVVLNNCPQCKIGLIRCDSALDTNQRAQLSESPLATASGRMSSGVVLFQATIQDLALAACRTAETESATTLSPVKCYPASAPRPKPTASLVLSPWSLALLFVAFATAWLAGWLIVKYEHLHAHLSHDHVDSGPQKYHTQPTPRIGGLAVKAGLLAAGGIMLYADAIPCEREFGLLLIAGIPAFIGGLVEDVTKKVGVLERLLLTMLSGAVAAWLLGTTLNRLDVPGIDQAMTWLPFAVVFTSFAVGGVANAINIIDGYNGLAGGFAVIVLTALAFVAHQVGDILVFSVALAVIGSLLGFLVWNWPGGRIFLGDGGAYLLGFILAELSVLLIARNPTVSPWFPLLLLIYPIFETFYSIYRRKFQNKLSPGQPDNQHLHQLIHDKRIPHQPHGKRFSRNSKVAKYLWIPTGVLAALGSVFAGSTSLLASAALGFCVFYVVNYWRIAGRRIGA